MCQKKANGLSSWYSYWMWINSCYHNSFTSLWMYYLRGDKMTLQNYKIWTNDGLIEKEDAGEMRHVDPQAAVVEFIEAYDQGGDFYFASNTSTDVVIFCEDEEGHITQWNITVETVPQYYATEIK